MLLHSLQLLRPFASEPSAPLCIHALLLSAAVVTMASLVHPEHFQSKGALNLVRNLLGWSAPAFAGRIRAGATPLGVLAAREFVLFVSYLSCGLALLISPFFLLLLEVLGLQLQHVMPHSILQAAIFAHLCKMFVGVAPCTSLFRHFFVLLKSGKAKDHLGAYYFQTRPDSIGAYISSLGGMRWENWRANWVIVSTEANDRLALPSDGPRLDRKQWRAKPSLAPEFLPVLDRIKTLAAGGLTLIHVVGDFLKRRITPLQKRARLCCWFTGSNYIDRIQRGLGTDLSWEELELLVKGITGESFIPESLILPQGIPALCDDLGLRTAILASPPTLDKSGMAVRQTCGRDPHHGIQIPGVPAGGSQPTGAGSRAPLTALAPWTRAKGLQAAPLLQVAPGGWRKRGDAGCVAPMDHLFWILLLIWTPQKRQRTTAGDEETGSQAQDAQRRASLPPPPPSDPPPPPPPPPGGDLP
jgi:hypothetical protein